MVFNKKYRFLVLLFLFLNLISISYAVFPSFEFTSSNIAPGQVDISGKVSSGVKLELFVNNNFVSMQNIISPVKIINLTDEIFDTDVSIAATIRFVNSNPSKIFTINISGLQVKTLNYGDSYDFFAYKEGSYLIRNEQTGTSKNILVRDALTDFNFVNIAQSYLFDGQNNAKFILHSSKDFSTLDSLNYSFTYQKYINTITLTNFTNVSAQRKVNIKGVISDSNSPLKYIINSPGNIVNTGLLNDILTRPDGSFNITIGGLSEGINQIRFISLDKIDNDIYNGETMLRVLVDTQPPTLNIISATYTAQGLNGQVTRNADFSQPSIFMNGNVLTLNISTDSIIVNYTFNNKNLSCGKVINTTVSCKLNLAQGQNNLTLFGIDIAGNIAKRAHQINFDNKPLSLDQRKFDPKQGTTTHFFLQDIAGRVNKPEVNIMAFTMPQDNKYYYTDTRTGEQRQQTATCRDYEFLASNNVRTVGNLDYSLQSPEVDIQDKQISLLDFIQDKITATADGNGDFKIKNVVLKEKNLNDNYDTNSNKISSVNTQNTICFILSDKYGNVATQSYNLILDAGNTMWTSKEVTPTPSTIYAAEIEQTGDLRSGNGNVRVGIIARLHYNGAGKVKTLSSPRVSVDTKLNPEMSRYTRVVMPEMNYLLDKATNDMIIYFPVEIMPMNIKPLDYPEKLNLGFSVQLTYDLEEKQIPIDTVNPIFFQTSLNVERPLDTAKWLTPEMIDKGIAFLNKSIKFTKQATDFTGIAATVGVVACTGAKLWYGAKIELAKDNPAEQEKLKDELYHICDRVVCSATPNKCAGNTFEEGAKIGDPGIFKLTEGQSHYTESELSDIQILEEGNNRKSSTFSSLNNINEKNLCDFDGNGIADDGIYTNGISMNWDKVGPNDWVSGPTTTINRFNHKCVSYKELLYDKDEKYITPKGVGKDLGKYTEEQKQNQDYNTKSLIDLKSAGGTCYQAKSPRFDDARSWPYKNTNNPKNNIIESVRGGCITDTYSHLKNYLQIQESIKGCLEQAKIGVTQGSYCERLMSQAVCDIATNVLFKTVAQKSTATNSNDPHTNPFTTLLSGAQNGDKLLNERYDGNAFYSQAGLGSTQVANKVCLAAFTGDWSMLTQNILSALDKNQIEPTFGPMFPVSRIQGYNPLTGALSIRYIFTYAGISGGQSVSSKVELICDSSKPGADYCPENSIIDSVQAGSSFFPPNLVIQRGNSRQDSIVLTDTKAKFRYNVVRITHTYELNGKKKTKIQEENIFHKDNGLIASCSWNGGVYGTGVANDIIGILCNPLFGPESTIAMYSINDRKTKLVPTPSRSSNPTYYPGNKVLVDLNYDIRDTNINGAQTDFNLWYKSYCSKDVVPAFNKFQFKATPGAVNSHQIIPTVTIPEFGTTTTTGEYYTSEIQLHKGKKIKEIQVKNFAEIAEKVTGSFRILKIFVDNKEKSGANVVFDVKDGKLVEPNKFIEEGWMVGGSKVKIEIDRNLNNIDLILVLDNGQTIPFSVPKKQERSTSTKNLQSVQSDQTCTIEMRILPASVDISVAEFNKYNTNGEDILTDVNSKGEIVKKTFYVKDNTKKGETPKLTLEVIEPIKDASLCAKEKDSGKYEVEIPLSIAAISSDKEFGYDGKRNNFEIKLALDRYTSSDDWKKTGEDVSLGYKDNIFENKNLKFDIGKIDFSTSQKGKLYVTYKTKGIEKEDPRFKEINKIIQINLNKCN